jgi:chromatin licensing and DNA replication factor 1
MPQSFRRRFSQKLKENVHPEFQSDSFQPLAVPVSESSLKISSTSEVANSHQKPSSSELSSVSSSSEACRTIHGSSDCFTPAGVTPATPSKPVEYTESKDGSMKSIEPLSTPARFVSTPARLMTATPALKPPKRHFMSPDDNSTSSPDKLVKRPPSSRSLKFNTPMKNENAADGLSSGDDILDILPDYLLHSVCPFFCYMKENLRSFICFANNRSVDFKFSYISRWLLFLCNGLNLILQIREKERIAMEERDPAISQAKKRKKIIASLPKLFNMIDMMFHSKNRSVMTKEELMSNIVSNHRDIIDRSKIHFFKK